MAEETKSSQDEAKELLQKGLTIFEIDKEVARLNEQDAKIGEQINQNEQDIVKQNGNVEATRKHAAKYYEPTIPEIEIRSGCYFLRQTPSPMSCECSNTYR